MHAFNNYSYSENALQQCDPTANMLDNVLHPWFGSIVFLMKLFKNFKKQVDLFNATSDSLVKKTRPSN